MQAVVGPCVACELFSPCSWAGAGGLVLRRLGGRKCEQRGEMKGYWRRGDEIARQEEDVIGSGKDACGTPAVAVGLHLGLDLVGSHKG